ncbi:MAG: PLP-dependent aminotransferase family protein [Desulfobacterales bacterium]|nr:PLP-dependent aminotransferase family protein [Desulfobacterales bacterium]
MARDLGVTQTTIRRAFEDLTKAGLVDSHVGRGTFVLDREAAVEEPGAGAVQHARASADPVDPEFMLAARRLRMGIAKSLDALTVLTERPGLIHFTSGVPDPALASDGVLERLTRDAFKAGQRLYSEYIPPPGLRELREALAERFRQSGREVTPDQILITSGSQQAISILAQSALESRRRVICETPCYMGIPKAFGALGHWVESVPRDIEGPLPERLNRFRDGAPSVLYLCPELHNPMGVDISPARRAMLLDWTREQKALLIADEIFHDLYFEAPDAPGLLTEVGPDQTVVIGSLSKSFMCGLRIGWMVSSAERIQSMGVLKRAMDIGCPSLMQGIALSLLRTGEYDVHLEKARRHYQDRRDAMLKALKLHMPEGVVWTTPKGGFHMWVELPAGYSSIVLFLLAIERGVAFFPGPQMDIDHRFVNAFRLSYGSLEINQIQEGIELLGGAVKDLLKDPPSDPGLSGLGDFI